ncbi:hypothetical protein BKA69DRAFT_1091235 [Paraphysoderma sedebokerense]|nr:hypothetical protein BKA69DRAFT_1091235 [Paraphysoderma sedebokerense]
MSEAKVSAFIEKQKDLVDHECKYEVQETANLIQGCPPQELQKRGNSIHRPECCVTTYSPTQFLTSRR